MRLLLLGLSLFLMTLAGCADDDFGRGDQSVPVDAGVG
jgi:hypothetical protein